MPADVFQFLLYLAAIVLLIVGAVRPDQAVRLACIAAAVLLFAVFIVPQLPPH
jgi:hypothetical protein